MDILLPYQCQQIRDGKVEYGTVEQVVAKRKSFCRCCGTDITKDENSLRFFWDFTGCGSWTASQATMHLTCAPASESIRVRANTEAYAIRCEKLAEKLAEKADNASQRAVVRRYERESAQYAERARKARKELAEMENAA
jgi:hypothetical protein